MKVKHLKWKKENDYYIANTVFGKTFSISPAKDRWYVYCYLDDDRGYADTLERAKEIAFKDWVAHLKYVIKREINELKCDLKRREKELSKCLEGEK